MPADTSETSKKELVRIIKIPLIAVDELGKQENCQGSGNVIHCQCVLIDACIDELRNLLRWNINEINDRVDDLEKIIAEKEVPGKSLSLADTDKKVDADQ